MTITTQDYEVFRYNVALRESSGNQYQENGSGYIGLYQFGEPALEDIGFYIRDSTTSINDYIGQWTETAHGYGVFNKDNFLSNLRVLVYDDPDPNLDVYGNVQDIAFRRNVERLWIQIRSNDSEVYDGQTLNGHFLTQSGIIAAAHLVGANMGSQSFPGLQAFIESGGTIIPKDGNGTKVTEYFQLFNDYQFPTDFMYYTFGGSAINGFTNNLEKDNELKGGSGNDILSGFAGVDTIKANGGNDRLSGDAGADTIYGGGDGDTLSGASGDDVFYGGVGRDLILIGGYGNDTIYADNDDVIVTVGNNPQR